MTVLKVENPIEIYQTNEGETAIEVRLQEETVWLTQKQMAEVFNTTPQNITIHLKNVFEEGELEEAAKTYLASTAQASAAQAYKMGPIATGNDHNNREIIYLRYDDINMKYIYLCVHCDTVWKTDNRQ